MLQLQGVNDTTAFSGNEILITMTINIGADSKAKNYFGGTSNQMVPYFVYHNDSSKFSIYGYTKKVSTG